MTRQNRCQRHRQRLPKYSAYIAFNQT